MSAMSTMDAAIKELRTAAEMLQETANWLAEQFSTDNAAKPAPSPTLEEVRAILAEFSRKGHIAQIRDLFAQYGATKLSEVDPSHYAELLEAVGGMNDAT